jgi:polyferredoxin
MACFLVPMGEAIVTTVIQKVVEKKEKKVSGEVTVKTKGKWSQRLGWLNTMLWGGCLFLALEHVWHGEIVPWPPFLTAMESASETSTMLHELALYGITMAVVIPVVWAVMCVVAELRSKAKALPKEKEAVRGGA